MTKFLITFAEMLGIIIILCFAYERGIAEGERRADMVVPADDEPSKPLAPIVIPTNVVTKITNTIPTFPQFLKLPKACTE